MANEITNQAPSMKESPSYFFEAEKKYEKPNLEMQKSFRKPGTADNFRKEDPKSNLKSTLSGKKFHAEDFACLKAGDGEPQKIKVDENFKYIDNSPNGKLSIGTGHVSTDDTIVIKVSQPDGTWVTKGMSVNEFLFNPRLEYQFEKNLDTPGKRLQFLRRMTGKDPSLTAEDWNAVQKK